MNSDLTFVFDEDGKAHALKEGKVVASADSVEELETIIREADAAFAPTLEVPSTKKRQEAETLGAEEEDEEEAKEASTKQSAPPMLGMGASGQDVTGLQKALGVKPDGQFGQQTQQAVMDYQKQNNLGADGIVGPETTKSLLSDKADNSLGAQKRPPSPADAAAGAISDAAGAIGDITNNLGVNKNMMMMKPLVDAPNSPSPSNSPAGSLATPGPLLDNKAPGASKPPSDLLDKTKSLIGLGSTKESGCDCWDGYERVPGTKPCAEGSCRKCDDHRSKEKESATHVVTPNGLKGRILGKTKDVWGDTVTVRFENGRIVQFPVSDNMKFATEEDARPESPIAALRERLEAPVEGDRTSLISRANELKSIRNEVAQVMSKGASYEEEIELDTIAVEAATELNEVAEALEHLASDEVEAFKPFEPKVVEQASVGTQDDGTWLDDTFGRMVSEANATDFDQLMAEGPEAFIVELDSAALADAGVTREMASSFVQEKTAGANPDARKAFENAWIDRVESLRREELLNRKTKAKKEAAAEESDTSNLPDDVLFG